MRAVRRLVDDILRQMSAECDAFCAAVGRPSIPPKRLLRAQLLQLFYSVRSERLLMEQLDDDILFRWFVGLELDEPIWVPTVFTKNRDRLLMKAVAQRFLPSVVAQGAPWMSDEHSTVDETLIEAWASHVEVHALADVLGEEPRQPDGHQHGGAPPRDPRDPHPRSVAAREAHDERAPCAATTST